MAPCWGWVKSAGAALAFHGSTRKILKIAFYNNAGKKDDYIPGWVILFSLF